MTGLFRISILVVLSMVFMFSMNVKLAIIALIPMPIIILYSLHFHNKIGAGFKDCDEAEGRLSAMAQENLTGVRVVRAFGKTTNANASRSTTRNTPVCGCAWARSCPASGPLRTYSPVHRSCWWWFSVSSSAWTAK